MKIHDIIITIITCFVIGFIITKLYAGNAEEIIYIKQALRSGYTNTVSERLLINFQARMNISPQSNQLFEEIINDYKISKLERQILIYILKEKEQENARI